MMWGGQGRCRCDRGGKHKFYRSMGCRGLGRVDIVVDCRRGGGGRGGIDRRDSCGFS